MRNTGAWVVNWLNSGKKLLFHTQQMMENQGVGGQASDRGHQPVHTAVRDEGQQEGGTRKSD